MAINSNDYDVEQLKRDMRELKFENRVQTIAVVLLFFFGVSTIYDIVKKNKNG